MVVQILKIPGMTEAECVRLVSEQFVSRIAFRNDGSTYIAPFMYVFDGRHMYFLSTRYGRKLDYFRQSPDVSVEVEQYAPDMSSYRFVTLHGRLEDVRSPDRIRMVRQQFVDLFRVRGLSRNALAALGHSPSGPVEAILSDAATAVWKLTGVRNVVGLKSVR